MKTSRGRIHHLRGGSGAPIVLLHSNGGSAYDFEAMFARLSRSREVIAWDMPGQGDSDPLSGHLTVEDYADAVVELMDGLGIGSADVLGASIGGAVCASLAARHAPRMRQFFIVECPLRSEADWLSQWPRIEANFSQPVQNRTDVEARVKQVSPEFLRRWNIDRCKAGAKTMMSVMWALREYDAAPDLQLMPARTTVVYGNRGPAVQSVSRLSSAMNDPRIEIIEDCGHFPMFDAPGRLCDIVEKVG